MAQEFSTNLRTGSFPTTRWNLVNQATEGHSEDAKKALEELCQAYWYPIYVFIRGKGYTKADAEDLTQGYFSNLLQRESLNKADSNRGKLRTFLLTDLKCFIADETRRQSAQKRGGGTEFIPLETDALEEPFPLTQQIDPEALYMKAWASTLINCTTENLRQRYIQSGKGALFDLISEHLYGKKQGIPYTEIASQLRTSISSTRLAVFRLRQKFRSLLEAEIAHTVESSNDIESEIEYLFQVVSNVPS